MGPEVPLGTGARLEVRRVTETEEFPQDNEWVQKEVGLVKRRRRLEVVVRERRGGSFCNTF